MATVQETYLLQEILNSQGGGCIVRRGNKTYEK